MNYPARISILILLALIAYALPWVVNPGTALSQGGYDLAEWVSIHPAVRASNPPLLTSMLLRLPLVLLAIIVGFAVPGKPFRTVGWWIALVSIGLFALSSLPPLDFFTSAADRSDPNYQQQFTLSIIALGGGLLGMTGFLPKVRPYVVIVTAVTTIAVSLIGLSRAYDLMQGINLNAEIGMGLYIFVVMTCLLVLNSAYFAFAEFNEEQHRYQTEQ